MRIVSKLIIVIVVLVLFALALNFQKPKDVALDDPFCNIGVEPNEAYKNETYSKFKSKYPNQNVIFICPTLDPSKPLPQ